MAVFLQIPFMFFFSTSFLSCSWKLVWTEGKKEAIFDKKKFLHWNKFQPFFPFSRSLSHVTEGLDQRKIEKKIYWNYSPPFFPWNRMEIYFGVRFKIPLLCGADKKLWKMKLKSPVAADLVFIWAQGPIALFFSLMVRVPENNHFHEFFIDQLLAVGLHKRIIHTNATGTHINTRT